MKTDSEEIDRVFIFRFLALQLAVALTAASLLEQFIGRDAAVSGLVGGLIGLLGNAWFAKGVFKPAKTRPAKEMLVSFYASEISKLVIVITLFFLAFKFIDELKEANNALMMFLSFAAVQCVTFFVPLMMKTNQK